MSIDSKVTARLEDMVALGQKVLNSKTPSKPIPPTDGVSMIRLPYDHFDDQLAYQWLTSCCNLVSRVFGESSIHYEKLKKCFKDNFEFNDIEFAFGVLLAAKDDYEKDSLFDVKQLIEADLFDDFLEQAEHQLSLGYFPVAAVITGCVLEDGLRKMCKRNGIQLTDKPKLDWMNSELVKVSAYSKFVQKKVTYLADLRNNASHGKWEEFESKDVEEMLRNVRDFMERIYTS